MVTPTSSPSWPLVLMMTRLSRMKLSTQLIRHSSTPAFLMPQSKHPLTTLGKAAATSMRRAPAIAPRPHASWTWAMATPTASTADRFALHPYWPRCSLSGRRVCVCLALAIPLPSRTTALSYTPFYRTKSCPQRQVRYTGAAFSPSPHIRQTKEKSEKDRHRTKPKQKPQPEPER